MGKFRNQKVLATLSVMGFVFEKPDTIKWALVRKMDIFAFDPSAKLNGEVGLPGQTGAQMVVYIPGQLVPFHGRNHSYQLKIVRILNFKPSFLHPWNL